LEHAPRLPESLLLAGQQHVAAARHRRLVRSRPSAEVAGCLLHALLSVIDGALPLQELPGAKKSKMTTDEGVGVAGVAGVAGCWLCAAWQGPLQNEGGRGAFSLQPLPLLLPSSNHHDLFVCNDQPHVCSGGRPPRLPAAAANGAPAVEIDEDLHSRQVRWLGGAEGACCGSGTSAPRVAYI